MADGKKKQWTLREEEILIRLWDEKLMELSRARDTSHILKAMGRELNAYGYYASVGEIKSKMKNITTKYGKEKALIRPGGSPSTWKFFHQVDKILGYPKNNNSVNIPEKNGEERKSPSRMDSQEFEENICRICLDKDVTLNWNDTLDGYCDITYKYCFYKYTQLENLSLDTYSAMLCQYCSDGLYNAHVLISKALESHKYFKEKNLTDSKLSLSINSEGDIKYTPTNFETVLLENTGIESILPDSFVSEQSEEELMINLEEYSTVEKIHKRHKTATLKTTSVKKYILKNNGSIIEDRSIKESNRETDISDDTNLSQPVNESSRESQTEYYITIEEQEADQYDIKCEEDVDQDELLNITITNADAQEDSKIMKNKKRRICSICSKVCCDVYVAREHEEIHNKNRERTEVCQICDLRFYSRQSLRSHMLVHKENREKEHKCEFCDKAFFNKGGLNIHRRIHLGLMIPCSLCSKEFYRQIDLERHMCTHSASKINSDMKKRPKYFVRCKYCDKSILSTRFRSHTAVHLNEPLVKCSICSKEFFRRDNCVLHVKNVHKKTDNYKDFVIQYENGRISHLFLKQKADIQLPDDQN